MLLFLTSALGEEDSVKVTEEEVVKVASETSTAEKFVEIEKEGEEEIEVEGAQDSVESEVVIDVLSLFGGDSPDADGETGDDSMKESKDDVFKEESGIAVDDNIEEGDPAPVPLPEGEAAEVEESVLLPATDAGVGPGEVSGETSDGARRARGGRRC